MQLIHNAQNHISHCLDSESFTVLELCPFNLEICVDLSESGINNSKTANQQHNHITTKSYHTIIAETEFYTLIYKYEKNTFNL